jgi:hypothetical protein
MSARRVHPGRKAWWAAKSLIVFATALAVVPTLLSLPFVARHAVTGGYGALAVPVMVGAITFVAAILLGLRDGIGRSRRENARPVGERIEEIRQAAVSAIEGLPRFRDQLVLKSPDRADVRWWIEPVIEYYRRVERLAATPDTPPEDALKLAEEAGQFIRENKIKGILVADLADRLAELLDRRDRESTNR